MFVNGLGYLVFHLEVTFLVKIHHFPKPNFRVNVFFSPRYKIFIKNNSQ